MHLGGDLPKLSQITTLNYLLPSNLLLKYNAHPLQRAPLIRKFKQNQIIINHLLAKSSNQLNINIQIREEK
jgi:hypothetical protein